MPRKRIIGTDELLALIDKYRLEHPDEKIKIPQLGDFIRKTNPDVADRLIRRNDDVMKHIEELNSESPEAILQTVANFRTMDVDSFLKNNRTPESLRKALFERDRYYAQMHTSAAKLYTRYEERKAELISLQIKYEELERAYSKLRESKERKAARREKDTIRKLRRIINTYVNPEIANEIFRREGLIELQGTTVNTDALDEVFVTAKANITEKVEAALTRMMEKDPTEEIQEKQPADEKTDDIADMLMKGFE